MTAIGYRLSKQISSKNHTKEISWNSREIKNTPQVTKTSGKPFTEKAKKVDFS